MKSIIIALFFPLCCVAQQPKPLQIGDTLPVQAWEQLNNTYFLNPGGLSPFGGLQGATNRLIILDFWATWCTSCVKELPFMDSIQRNSNDFRVLLVGKKSTIDTYERVADFFTKRKNSGADYSNLPAVVGDTLLNKYFPHDFIPFYAVLDDHLVVRALLKWDQMNIGTLTKIIASAQTLPLNEKPKK